MTYYSKYYKRIIKLRVDSCISFLFCIYTLGKIKYAHNYTCERMEQDNLKANNKQKREGSDILVDTNA